MSDQIKWLELDHEFQLGHYNIILPCCFRHILKQNEKWWRKENKLYWGKLLKAVWWIQVWMTNWRNLIYQNLVLMEPCVRLVIRSWSLLPTFTFACLMFNVLDILWILSTRTWCLSHVLFLSGPRGLCWSRNYWVLEGHCSNTHYGQLISNDILYSRATLILIFVVFFSGIHVDDKWLCGQVCNPSIQFMIYESSLKHLKARRAASKKGSKSPTALEV